MQSTINSTIHHPRLRTGLWLASALGFCLLGQHYFNSLPEYRVDAIIFYMVGLFSFWQVLARLGAPSSPAPRPSETPFEPVSRRWPLMFVSLLLAALAYWACANNTFTRLGVLAWIGAVLSFLVAMWPATPIPALPLAGGGSGWGLGEGLTIHLPWRTAALLAIIALAAFFRLYRLEQVPPEMTSDHIEKLLDIHDLANGVRPIYFERNTGREPFQFYWTFTVMRVFNTGITFYGLKLANALIGILAIYGIYLLGRELAGQDVGLLAAFLASVMQWANSITRMGLRFPYATVATAFALWALLRALRTGRRADYLVAGVILGAGFYGYTPFRVMPIVVAVLVVQKLLVEPPRSRPGWSQLALNLVVLGAITAIVFVPLGRYWHDRPEMFWHRTLTRIEGEYGATPGDVWLTLGRNTLRALGMFNVVGDSVWANTVPYKPALDEVGGAFLLLGVLAALYRLFKPRASGQRRDWPLLMAIGSGVILLLPSILSLAFPNENPSVVRAAGAIPVVAVLAALGIYAAAHGAKALGGARWGSWLAALLLAIVLAATTYLNYQRYFVSYLASYRMASQNSSEMAESMRGFIATGGDLKHITIRAWPHWVDTRALALIMGDVSWQDTNVVIDRIDELTRQRDDPAPQMYLLHRNDKDGLALLQKTFPLGYAVVHRSPIPGHDYVLFLVPAR